jgi:putative AdoMet-dependent methyltransferase
MKSKFGEKFNHDFIAEDYDSDVRDISNPIRLGYAELLKWVSEKAEMSRIALDLGCGTGNTTNSLDGFDKVFCVDISENMLSCAKEKLKNRKNIFFIKDDLLNSLDKVKEENIDTIISTYAIHHLIQEEKHILFEKANDILQDGGKIIFGDLMFENKEYKKEMEKKYPNLVEDFEEEFFWFIDEEVSKLKELGFVINIEKFSDLSWGVYGKKKKP